MSKKIAIGCDHAGFPFKQPLINWLNDQGYEVVDYGAYSDQSSDYADFAHPVARAVEQGEVAKGVLICGSGQGVCMTANKHQGIRAALVWDESLARLSRQHNNANIICFPARFIPLETAIRSLDIFLKTAFDGGRHEGRIKKMSCGG